MYQATDSKLGRSVAVKFLPESFAHDADRVSRFEREARVLALLNHPNIAAIYGLEDSGGKKFLVMELVPGETLAERIQRGPLPLNEALDIAKQNAEALEAAHEKGVIHRDLKPANIKLTPEGKVKVLDFGLAKALGPADSAAGAQGVSAAMVTNSPTLSMAATQAGIILGTAAYMSPEQAKGSVQIDRRSDIFSFGCVLFEMLTGRQPFQGETITETLAWVLARDVDFNLLPVNLNPRVRDLLRRCLEKDVKKRWQAVGDLRVEIETILSDPAGVDARPAATFVPRSRMMIAALIVAGAIAGAAIAGVAMWRLRPAAAAPKIAQFSFALPQDQQFWRAGRHVLSISPDGASIVYTGNQQLYLRRLAEMEARPIPGTSLDVSSPVFSPDGQWVAFWSGQDATLKKIAVTGGAAVTLGPAQNPTGASWADDTILYGQGTRGVMAVAAAGGNPEVWVKSLSDEVMDSPQLLPDGYRVLLTVTHGTGQDRWDKANIVVASRKTGERNVLIQGGSAARYVPTGHIVYAIGNNLLAVPFDLSRLQVTGSPIPILEGVMRDAAGGVNTGVADFGFSADGTLVYVPSSSGQNAALQLAFIDRNGKADLLRLPGANYESPRLSPDGKHLSVAIIGDGGTVWIYDMSGTSSLRRLTFEGINQYPVWSPDGRRVAYASTRDGKSGIFVQAADGTGVAERLTMAQQGFVHSPQAWSPDGNTLTFGNVKGGTGDLVIWMVALTGDRKAEPLVAIPGSLQGNSSFSPDGRWIAYQSDEATAGTSQVYIQPFPPTGAKYQISRDNGEAPAWSPDGKELFYFQQRSRKLLAVRVQTQPSFSFADPVTLPIDLFVIGANRNYDVAPDGRFIVPVIAGTVGAGQRTMERINTVLNWFEDLKQRVPGRR